MCPNCCIMLSLGGHSTTSLHISRNGQLAALPALLLPGRWNGKTFKQLPEDAQQRVRHYPVTCLLVKRKPQA